jgi:hypothetical protein
MRQDAEHMAARSGGEAAQCVPVLPALLTHPLPATPAENLQVQHLMELLPDEMAEGVLQPNCLRHYQQYMPPAPPQRGCIQSLRTNLRPMTRTMRHICMHHTALNAPAAARHSAPLLDVTRKPLRGATSSLCPGNAGQGATSQPSTPASPAAVDVAIDGGPHQAAHNPAAASLADMDVKTDDTPHQAAHDPASASPADMDVKPDDTPPQIARHPSHASLVATGDVLTDGALNQASCDPASELYGVDRNSRSLANSSHRLPGQMGTSKALDIGGPATTSAHEQPVTSDAYVVSPSRTLSVQPNPPVIPAAYVAQATECQAPSTPTHDAFTQGTESAGMPQPSTSMLPRPTATCEHQTAARPPGLPEQPQCYDAQECRRAAPLDSLTLHAPLLGAQEHQLATSPPGVASEEAKHHTIRVDLKASTPPGLIHVPAVPVDMQEHQSTSSPLGLTRSHGQDFNVQESPSGSTLPGINPVPAMPFYAQEHLDPAPPPGFGPAQRQFDYQQQLSPTKPPGFVREQGMPLDRQEHQSPATAPGFVSAQARLFDAQVQGGGMSARGFNPSEAMPAHVRDHQTASSPPGFISAQGELFDTRKPQPPPSPSPAMAEQVSKFDRNQAERRGCASTYERPSVVHDVTRPEVPQPAFALAHSQVASHSASVQPQARESVLGSWWTASKRAATVSAAEAVQPVPAWETSLVGTELRAVSSTDTHRASMPGSTGDGRLSLSQSEAAAPRSDLEPSGAWSHNHSTLGWLPEALPAAHEEPVGLIPRQICSSSSCTSWQHSVRTEARRHISSAPSLWVEGGGAVSPCNNMHPSSESWGGGEPGLPAEAVDGVSPVKEPRQAQRTLQLHVTVSEEGVLGQDSTSCGIPLPRRTAREHSLFPGKPELLSSQQALWPGTPPATRAMPFRPCIPNQNPLDLHAQHRHGVALQTHEAYVAPEGGKNDGTCMRPCTSRAEIHEPWPVGRGIENEGEGMYRPPVTKGCGMPGTRPHPYTAVLVPLKRPAVAALKLQAPSSAVVRGARDGWCALGAGLQAAPAQHERVQLERMGHTYLGREGSCEQRWDAGYS